MNKDKKLEMLDEPENLIIFTTVPTGLGHLRVTDALSDGMPFGERAVLLGVHNRSATFFHRLASVSTYGRRLGEWIQRGRQEAIFTPICRKFLEWASDSIYEQLTTLLDSWVRRPAKILIISTHFILAHQIAYVRERIERQKNVKIFLVVVVTDDSPQFLWFVPGTDLTFVPSRKTAEVLSNYAQKAGLAEMKLVVNAYPVHPFFSRKMPSESLKVREKQLTFQDKSTINVSIPVSGAAVGLLFDRHIIESLHAKNKRYKFFVVAKNAAYTAKFLNNLERKDYVSTFSSISDREVVDYYERIFKENVMSLEITKPSEQAFKTLLMPGEQGGVIMLFTQPVGRQEYDNLYFMERHHLIPVSEIQEKLWRASEMSISLRRGQEEISLDTLGKYRGFRLPLGSEACALFIEWCLREGILAEMLKFDMRASLDREHHNEIGGDGVGKFWEKVTGEFLKM